MTEPLVRADISRVEAALKRMARFGRDLTPVLRDARKPVLRDQMDHRKRQEGPDGKWPARSPFTKERLKAKARAAGRKRAGKLLGKLPTALKLTIEPRRLQVISRVPWSGTHQDGHGRVGRAPSLPRRQFLWISPKLLGEVRDIILSHAAHAWDKP